jgi:hypothetical protein
VGNAADGSRWADDPTVQALLTDIARRHDTRGRVAAVLMYGSYLRGRRDTLLDFYVLLDDFADAIRSPWQRLANRMLPPNVYYQHVREDAGEARAKYATMTMAQFERALGGDFHPYFWARFTQPCALVYARDESSRQRVVQALESAVATFISAVAPLLPAAFSARELWQTGFGLTYGTELRAESGARIAELYETHAGYFDALCRGYARQPRAEVREMADGRFQRTHRTPTRRARREWLWRRWLGKLLSALRIVKAAGTFEDPLDYLLWKIQRHSGIYIEPTDRQRQHPLLFAWPLLWRLYRLGAFR